MKYIIGTIVFMIIMVILEIISYSIFNIPEFMKGVICCAFFEFGSGCYEDFKKQAK